MMVGSNPFGAPEPVDPMDAFAPEQPMTMEPDIHQEVHQVDNDAALLGGMPFSPSPGEVPPPVQQGLPQQHGLPGTSGLQPLPQQMSQPSPAALPVPAHAPAGMMPLPVNQGDQQQAGGKGQAGVKSMPGGVEQLHRYQPDCTNGRRYLARMKTWLHDKVGLFFGG